LSDTIDTPPLDEAPPRRLVRVQDGRWLGGVAAGLGRYFDVNPLVYRIAFAALALAGGTGILLYLAAWLVIPAEGSEDSTAVQALREHRDRPWLLLGVGLLLFTAVLIVSEADLWTGFGNVWLAALLGGSALLWWHLAHRDQRPAPPAEPAASGNTATATAAAPAPVARPPRPQRKPSLAAPVLGALLAVAGTLGLLAVLDVYEIDLDLALAGALAIVGVAIAVGAFTGFRVGSLVALGLVLLGGFAFAASLPVSLSAGIGDKVDRPLDAAALERSYEYGIGDYELDLTNVALAAGGETHVDVSLGIGALEVRVPDDVALEVDARAGAGEVLVLGSADDGIGADREVSVPGAKPDSPRLVLDADVGFGQIEILRG
jgi:phage shock protein PspC (stress-responsive transcriptional regulator)